MSSFRLCLFRGLVAVATGLMVTSFIGPWWTTDIKHEIVGFVATVNIYPYGIPSTEAASQLWAADITPLYQTVLAWAYLGISVGLILYSTRLRGRKGRWLLGGIGLSYIAYAAIAVIWIAIRTGDFGISLQGHSSIVHPGGVGDAYAGLQSGYYLALAVGVICVGLAIARDRITGIRS